MIEEEVPKWLPTEEDLNVREALADECFDSMDQRGADGGCSTDSAGGICRRGEPKVRLSAHSERGQAREFFRSS